jgi:diguanylate cyclase (GGDEF)-like protein
MQLLQQIHAYDDATVGNEGRVFELVRFASRVMLTVSLFGSLGTYFFDGLMQTVFLVATVMTIIASLGFSFMLQRLKRKQMILHRRLLNETSNAQRQIEQLFALTDTLQSADTNEHAAYVLQSASRRLLPGCGGALYVFNNSRDRLDLIHAWDMPEGYVPTASLTPVNCWALKRGKDHLNDMDPAALSCSHYVGEVASIEVPMLARGAVFGLLILADRHGKGDNVENARRLARALADSTSLALSNISLREQLRTQSLRDPMTGLYNRRYMEDALERFAAMAQRRKQSTAAVMIDLDDFKKLNDEHGHAKGDAVLKDVAAQLVGAVRSSDIVCRYGGEELLVILPECSLQEAVERAEIMRARIAALSDSHGCQISASLGVSSIAETAGSATELLSSADNALYLAKSEGKNQVKSAPRTAKGSRSPQLVSTM